MIKKINLIYLYISAAAILSFFQLYGKISNVLFYASVVLMFLAAITHPAESIGIYLILSYSAMLYENSMFLFIAFVIGVMIRLVTKNSFFYITFDTVMVFLLLCCTLITYLYVYSSMSVYILLCCDLLLFYSIKKQNSYIKSTEKNLSIIEIELIVASFLCSYFSIIASSDDATRLRIFGEGNVRSLANCIGLAIIFSVFNVSKGSKPIKILRFIVIFSESIVLLMTGSRGVLYSVVAVVILYLILTGKKKHVIGLAVFTGIVLLLAPKILPQTYDLERIYDVDNSSRMQIWKMIISGTKPIEWLLGAGLNTAYGRYGWYSHSVFVDCATSLGLPAFIVLVALIVSMIKETKVRNDAKQFCMIVFAIIMFVTHGSVFTSAFWIFLSFASFTLEPKNEKLVVPL